MTSVIATERLDLVLLTAVLEDLVEGRRTHAAASIGAEIPDGWPDTTHASSAFG